MNAPATRAPGLEFRVFTPYEQGTWALLFSGVAVTREQRMHPMFARGVEALALDDARVPDLDLVNARLAARTGFEGVPVEGHEPDGSFFWMLRERRFPIGNFIRERADLSYTPAPDVFHDLYGHLPLLADARYAEFCAQLGDLACRLGTSEARLAAFGRLFWFALEFGLVETPPGRRILGAGLASSRDESQFALGPEPELRAFDLNDILFRPFRIDEFQRTLFVLRDLEQLYGCLGELEPRLRAIR